MRIADTDGEGTLSREELREAVHKLSSGAADAADDEEITLERALHEWLGFVFLPQATGAIKRKKLANAADKFTKAGGGGLRGSS